MVLSSSPDSSAQQARGFNCKNMLGNYFLIRDVSCFQEEQLGVGGGGWGPSGGNLLGEKMSWELFTWHSGALQRFWVSREAERQNCGWVGGGQKER